jgi:hypothetical protein
MSASVKFLYTRRAMMRSILFVIALFGSFSAFAGEQIRNVTSFTSIRSQGAMVVYVEVGKPLSVRVVGDDKTLSKVSTDVFGEELLISFKEKHSLRSSEALTIYVSMPNLTRYKMEGAGKTIVNNVQGESLTLLYEGVGMLSVNGKVKNLKLSAEGIGMVDAKNLIADDVNASVEGIGSVRVFATEKLVASVDGIGSLHYYGNPRSIKKTISGIGSVKQGD